MIFQRRREGPTQPDSGVVVVASKRRLPILAIAAALVLVALAAIVYFVQHRNTPDPPRPNPYTLDNGLPDDYLLLTPDQAATKLRQETGLELATLAKQKLTDKSFKNFDEANKAAQALYAAGKYDKSYEAFAIAAKIVPKQVDYHFYLNYASLADRKGDQKLKLQLANQAKTAIKNDPSLSDARKADEVDKIDQKL